MKRLLMFGIVLLLVTNCGKKRQPVDMWPAYITGFENFSEDQRALFSGFVNTLNAEAGKTLISLSPLDEGYPISVRLTPPPANKPNQAGYATRSEENCHVDISTQLFDKTRESYQQSVFIHELGHCAGLNHVTTLGSVMYPIAQPFVSYLPTAIDEFVKTFTSSTQP